MFLFIEIALVVHKDYVDLVVLCVQYIQQGYSILVLEGQHGFFLFPPGS